MLKPDTLAMTAVLAMLTALGPLSTDMYLPSLPAITLVLGTTTAQAQVTLSAFLFGFAAGQFFYGPISDRYGRKPALLGGLALFIIASALCAFAPSIDVLIAARFLQALGASGPIVLARAVVRDLYEGSRAGKELSRMGTIMGVVPAIAPVFGGLLERAFGWRASFVATLAFGVVLAITVILRLPETLHTRTTDKLSPLGILRGYGSLLSVRSYRVYVLLTTLTYSGLFSFISGSSFVLQSLYGLSPVEFGLSFSLAVLGFMSGTLIAQSIVGRIGLERTIGVGVALLAAGGLAMLAGVLMKIPSSLAVTVPMMLYTAGVGLVLPQAQAAAMMPFPERAGAASSFLGICQMTLAACAGLLVGHSLGGTALPLPIMIAAMGVIAFAVYHGSGIGRVRKLD